MRAEQSEFPLDWSGPVDRPFEPFPEEAKAIPIITLLESMVLRYPVRSALFDRDIAITYAELWRRVAGWSEQITRATSHGDLIGIMAPAATASPVAMMACLAAGRPFVAIDPDYPPDWLATALDDSRPVMLLTVNADLCAPIRDSARTLELIHDAPCAAPTWRPTPLPVDASACVLYTSGATSAPRAIVNSQRNLLQRAAQSINAAHINHLDRLLTLASPCTIVTVRDIITALLSGVSIGVLDAQRIGARAVLEYIDERRVTILFAFPALLRALLPAGVGRVGRDLRLVRIGGDTVLASDICLLRARVSPVISIQLIYAATEAPIMQWFVGPGPLGIDDRMPIGYPLPGNALIVLDAKRHTSSRRRDRRTVRPESLRRARYLVAGTPQSRRVPDRRQ